MPLPKIYDWSRVQAALRLLAGRFPEFFPQWVLIGGGACWFYREALRQANDPDFPVPPCTPEEELVWLSKDVDFMGLETAEAEDLLQAPFKPETHTISYAGLELDFLEEGLLLTMRNAQTYRRRVHAGDLTFHVIAPEMLFAEKRALLAIKQRPQDSLHHAVLAQFLKHELCADAEAPAALDPTDWVERARNIKTADLSFFAHDTRFNARLAQAVHALDPITHKKVAHWAKHHLPNYTE